MSALSAYIGLVDFAGYPFLSPPVTSALQVWLDATQGVFSDAAGTIPANPGDPVAFWKDRSGSGNNASAPVGRRPILTARTLNGLNGLTFGAEKGYFTLPADLVLSQLSFLAVVKLPVASASFDQILFGGITTPQYLMDFSNFLFTRNVTTTITSSPLVYPSGFTIAELEYDPSLPPSQRLTWLFMGNAFDTGNLTGNFTVGEVSGRQNGTFPWVGSICELLLYNQKQSASQLATVRAYLKQKWFPVAHGHGYGGKKHINRMAMALLQAQRERADMRRIAKFQQQAKERLLAERIRQDQAELFHQQKVLAAASWTALLAEV